MTRFKDGTMNPELKRAQSLIGEAGALLQSARSKKHPATNFAALEALARAVAALAVVVEDIDNNVALAHKRLYEVVEPKMSKSEIKRGF